MDLIDKLISGGYLGTPAIIEAFRAIKRADFLPFGMPEKDLVAQINEAIPIGYGQTISQPAVVAFMIELLEPEPGNKILDIGFGSGWTTALLARVVSANNRKGKIIAIERIPELAEFGEKNIDKYGFIGNGTVTCVTGDGSLGFEAEKPFDRILASASAGAVPAQWKEQLKTGGIIVAPIENSIVKIKKVGEDEFERDRFEGFAFVPLI